MSIKRTIIAAIVGLTLVALVAPGVAQGVTIEDLLAQIAQLQAQLNALMAQQSGGTTTGGTVPANCVGVTFTRNLTIGSSGSDAKCLQSLFNQSVDTQLAASGVGSLGNETMYFGPLTRAAAVKYQEKYAASILTPVGLTLGTGFVGPSTRSYLNSALASGTTGGTTTGGTTGGEIIVPTGAGLTVQLASTNPASGTIVDGQALAPLAKLTLTNGDNAEVKITGLKLKRIGVSADASIGNLYLFDGVLRLTDGAAVSSTIINFNDSNGLFAVPAGGSKTISILADISAANAVAGETIGIQVVAATDVITNASSVNGTYPITSNLHTVASGTLAGVEFNATTTPSAASIDPQDDYTVWQNSVIVTTRAADMTRISFRKTGSVANSDLQNFRLYVDGVQTGSAVNNLDANGYVTFDLTGSPKRLEAGTRVIKLMADIIGGSNLNLTFHVWNVADVTVVDSQYLANITSDLVSDASFSKRSSGEQTVNSGVITFTKMTDSPSGNIVDTASNALLAKFQVKAAGEKIKIETLKVSVVVSDADVGYLRNGMLLANGVQIGSTSNLYDNTKTSPYYTSFSLGSSLIVVPGSPVTLEVRADIYDNDGTDDVNTDDTIQVRIEGSSSENNAIGQTSAATIDAPSSDVDANSLTVKTGGLTLSKNPAYTAQTVVAPVTAYKLASFNLVANTTEAVNITAINVAIDDVSSYASNLYVKYGTKTTSNKPTVAASNSWSINETLAAGATIPIEVYIDVSSLMTSGDGIATVDIDGTTVSSATSADSSGTVAGQTINFSTGAFAVAFASTPQNQVARGGQEVEIGRFKFTSSYNAYTIQEIKIDPDKNTSPGTSDNAEDAIVTMSLKDGSTVLATESFNNVDASGSTGGYYFTGLSVPVAASTSKTLIVAATFTVPSATAGNSGLRVIPALTYVKYMDPQGTVSTITDSTGDLYEANSTYVYRTVPTISQIDLTNSAIANGQVLDLYKFKVAAPSYVVGGVTYGDVYIKQFKIDLSWSDAVTADALELESLKLLKDGVDITSSVTIQDEDYGISVEGTNGVTEGSSKIIVVWDGNTEDTIQAGESTTYTIRGTPQGFVVSGAGDVTHDSVSLTFNTDSADVTFGSTTVDFIGFLNTDDTAQIGSEMSLYTSATASTSAEGANLIWSDGSAVAHSASTTAGTGDWTNSYLVKDSLSSETWIK